MRILLYIIIALLFASCSSKKTTKRAAVSEIGKYLYLGDNDILHVNESCTSLIFGKDDKGHKVYGKNYIDTAEFVKTEYMSFCTHCVTEKHYEKLQSISDRNHDGFSPSFNDGSNYPLYRRSKSIKSMVQKSNVPKSNVSKSIDP